jgi:hypothetical protein
VFRSLKVNQLRGKEKKIKQQFADGFTVERVYQKIFKAIYWNMIVCKDIKAMRKRARVLSRQPHLEGVLWTQALFSKEGYQSD